MRFARDLLYLLIHKLYAFLLHVNIVDLTVMLRLVHKFCLRFICLADWLTSPNKLFVRCQIHRR
jgi:hypothetical protein